MKITHSYSHFAVILSMILQLVAAPFTAASALAAAPALTTSLPLVDDFESGLPTGVDGTIAIGFVTFQDPNSTIAIAATNAPPAPVPGATDPNNVLQMNVNVVSFAGFAHAFENSTANQWVNQDWSAYAGISFWLYGNNSNTTLFIDVLDNRNPDSTKDDAERWSVDFKDDFSGWKEIQIRFDSLRRKEIGNGAPNDGLGLTEVHGWALGTITTPSPQVYYIDNVTLYGTAPVRPLTVGFTSINYNTNEGGTATITAKLSKPVSETVKVNYTTKYGSAIAERDYVATAGTLSFPPNSTQQSFSITTFDDTKYQGERGVLVELSSPTGGAGLGIPPVARVVILDNESYDPTLIDDFERYPYLWTSDANTSLNNPEIASGSPQALPGQGAYERVLEVSQQNGKGSYQFGRTFPIDQDWRESAGLSFWYYGQNSGRTIGVKLTNTQAKSNDPADWKLVWSDEFSSKPGTAPDPTVWGHEVGDGTVNGIPGWGNDELEYYTDSTENAATDGQGNLVITTKQADSSLSCYYGPCQYTSARLLTKNRFEVAYGRVEARVKVARGAGLWPAFWMLGTDIDQVSWPQTGEIDIMEYVGRLPNEIFGTIHGPGYSGGQSYGKSYDLGRPVPDDFHTFAVEWQPNKIVWYFDGIAYHQATPSDAFLQGKQWVFNHPFYMLLNVAVGGNFGGAVGAETTFPQSTLVDYVRLYQADSANVEFAASFGDTFTGWQQVTLPFTAFQDEMGKGVDLSAVRGLRFVIPDSLPNPVRLDQVRLTCVNDVTVTNNSDSGAGSLRKALGSVCVGGTVHAAASLAGQTITLLSGPLTLGKNVTIDGSVAPGLTISGNNSDRVVVVNSGTTATIRGLTLINGYGFELAGGILNNGTLTLQRVVVENNRVTTGGIDFWKGGGGIYNGDGSKLTLVESTVRNNSVTGGAGGGVYGFFNTTVTIDRSTINGNTANDVGGGIRSLGNFTIRNSTISSNTSTGWMGGAFFHTDGVMNIINSTIANNSAPDGTTGGGFVGTFTAANATLTLANSILTGNSGSQCFLAPFGSGAVTLASLGHNLVADASCGVPAPSASDLILADAKLAPLVDNGGPTLTHALQAGSPAIDSGDASLCPAIDQRGRARPSDGNNDGSAVCDRGAYEVQGVPRKANITILVEPKPRTPLNFRFFGPFGSFLLDNPETDDSDGVVQSISYSVVPGSYNFAENKPTGWFVMEIRCDRPELATVNLAQFSVNLNVKAGDEVQCRFINMASATVETFSYWDKNRSGTFDSGDEGQSGWWSALYDSTGKLRASNFNDASGKWTVVNLRPGTYTVCQNLRPGWYNTDPGSVNSAFGNRPCRTFAVGAGQTARPHFGYSNQPVLASEEMEDMTEVEVGERTILEGQEGYYNNEEFLAAYGGELPSEEESGGNTYLPMIAR